MVSTECEPITGVWGRAPSGVQGSSPWTGGQGAKPPEAESFLRIGHPNEGTNWPHIRVLNDRNCNFWEMGLMGERKGIIWGAPEAVWHTTEDRFIIGAARGKKWGLRNMKALKFEKWRGRGARA